jgi:hypothetical protein
VRFNSFSANVQPCQDVCDGSQWPPIIPPLQRRRCETGLDAGGDYKKKLAYWP